MVLAMVNPRIGMALHLLLSDIVITVHKFVTSSFTLACCVLLTTQSDGIKAENNIQLPGGASISRNCSS